MDTTFCDKVAKAPTLLSHLQATFAFVDLGSHSGLFHGVEVKFLPGKSLFDSTKLPTYRDICEKNKTGGVGRFYFYGSFSWNPVKLVSLTQSHFTPDLSHFLKGPEKTQNVKKLFFVDSFLSTIYIHL
jgi:hypothetical protein